MVILNSDLYRFDNYVAGFSNIINADIKEYDIRQANISILYDYNVLDRNAYGWLKNLPKHEREVRVGLMCKNKEVSRILQQGFKDARQHLFEINNIEDSQVLSIKKDAVYLIERTLKQTKFGSIDFRLASEYTSFYKLGGNELYFNGTTGVLDVKGINDRTLDMYHKRHFLALLKALFLRAETNDLETMLKIITFYIEKYLSYELDYDCYREFNRVSAYRLKPNLKSNTGEDLGVFNLDESLLYNFKECIDISYNYRLLTELYGYYFDRYMDKK